MKLEELRKTVDARVEGGISVDYLRTALRSFRKNISTDPKDIGGDALTKICVDEDEAEVIAAIVNRASALLDVVEAAQLYIDSEGVHSLQIDSALKKLEEIS